MCTCVVKVLLNTRVSRMVSVKNVSWSYFSPKLQSKKLHLKKMKPICRNEKVCDIFMKVKHIFPSNSNDYWKQIVLL